MQTTGLLSGAPSPTAPPQQFGSLHPGHLVPILRLESRPRHRQARHSCPLASQGLQTLLEPQVPTWAATPAERSPTVTCRYGQEQCDLGPSSHCQRTLAQARNPCTVRPTGPFPVTKLVESPLREARPPRLLLHRPQIVLLASLGVFPETLHVLLLFRGSIKHYQVFNCWGQ
jgi:hypothetical protein